ncbi:hypothetical protein FMUND_15381 [Fusarium mundagurra]|uniref:Uncharacterized protein n=1 Tax=Fusarium mundagurra TaxID=1567541 RepID=A0A8H5XPF5_9HYPO|nr:hypothetical protein FMUND_15381 [Fusarium mundagurra]
MLAQLQVLHCGLDCRKAFKEVFIHASSVECDNYMAPMRLSEALSMDTHTTQPAITGLNISAGLHGNRGFHQKVDGDDVLKKLDERINESRGERDFGLSQQGGLASSFRPRLVSDTGTGRRSRSPQRQRQAKYEVSDYIQ